MRRYITILILLATFFEVYQAVASPPTRFQRYNLRWNGRSGAVNLMRVQAPQFSGMPILPMRLNYPWSQYGRWLPVAGSRPTVPVFPWSPTNALANITYSTNRANRKAEAVTELPFRKMAPNEDLQAHIGGIRKAQQAANELSIAIAEEVAALAFLACRCDWL